jgi:hypothetical protein
MSNTPTDCEEEMSCTASMQFAERVEPIGPDILKTHVLAVLKRCAEIIFLYVFIFQKKAKGRAETR